MKKKHFDLFLWRHLCMSVYETRLLQMLSAVLRDLAYKPHPDSLKIQDLL